MSFESFVIKKAVPAPKIDSFSRYLFVGPHPDDIEVGAGATAAKLRSLGKEVVFLICTDGRYGLDHAIEGTTPEALAEIRKRESLESARLLGVTDVRFLELSDGAFYEPEELLMGIARIVGEVKPDVIFAPDPNVASECHEDHLRAGRASARIAFFAPFSEIMKRYGAESAPVKAIAYYMTARPNRFLKTGPIDRQLRALLCHKTQFPEGSDAFSEVKRYLSIRSALFGLRVCSNHAEGFRILSSTAMHCLPETGE